MLQDSRSYHDEADDGGTAKGSAGIETLSVTVDMKGTVLQQIDVMFVRAPHLYSQMHVHTAVLQAYLFPMESYFGGTRAFHDPPIQPYKLAFQTAFGRTYHHCA